MSAEASYLKEASDLKIDGTPKGWENFIIKQYAMQYEISPSVVRQHIDLLHENKIQEFEAALETAAGW